MSWFTHDDGKAPKKVGAISVQFTEASSRCVRGMAQSHGLGGASIGPRASAALWCRDHRPRLAPVTSVWAVRITQRPYRRHRDRATVSEPGISLTWGGIRGIRVIGLVAISWSRHPPNGGPTRHWHQTLDAGRARRIGRCVERDLIRTRTADGRSRAKAQGKQIGRPPSLTPAQQKRLPTARAGCYAPRIG